MRFLKKQSCHPRRQIVFFRAQSFTAIARDIEKNSIVGLYILHPNNIGRCGHLANASYAVDSRYRGQHIGELLVKHCIAKAGELGFRILQFNAVVATNVQVTAIRKSLSLRNWRINSLLSPAEYVIFCTKRLSVRPNTSFAICTILVA